ncbi:hypothetical protein HID58_038612 [Brassica napus]|uniref:Uncharacterized protein n=1 Tax=Brassica napus TaxID=3708 RepID=A0ABQ8BPP0_BRANA|nr:hypothetical protein HID58_038612 [Brassica napus]
MLISYLLHCLQNILMFLIRLYYDNDACVLRKMCLDAKAPHLYRLCHPLCLGSSINMYSLIKD